MAITVRYGDDGLALLAAQQAGEGQNFNRRFAQGQQLIQSTRQNQLQREALRLEAARLAQQPSRSYTTGPRPSQVPVTSTAPATVPDVSPFLTAPRMTGGSVSVEGGGERFVFDDGRLSGTRNTAGGVVPIPEEELQSRQSFVFGGPRQVDDDPRTRFLQQVIADPALPQQARAEIAALPPDLTESQLLLNVDRIRRRYGTQSGALPQSRLAELNLQNIRQEESQLVRRADELREALTEAGFDPSGPPTQFNPEVRDVGGPYNPRTPHQIFGFNINPFGQSPVQGGSPEGMTMFTEYQRTLKALDDLKQQKAQILQSGRPVVPTGPNSPLPEQPASSEDTDAELLRILKSI